MSEIQIGDKVDLESLPLELDFDSAFQEFGGVDPDKFGFRYPWGNSIVINDEKQGYPDDPMNLPSGHKPIFMRDDSLIIACTPTCWMDAEAVHGQPYTSGLITTEGKYDFYRGAVTVNAKLPKGNLAFPCPLWMLIQGLDGIPIPEWDIIECLGHTGKVLYQTVHSNMNLSRFGSAKVTEAQRQLIEEVDGGIDYTDDFHEYSGIWDSSYLYWLIDGVCTFKFKTPLDFDHGEFVRKFLLCNLAYDSGWSREQPKYDLKYAPDGETFPDAEWPVEMAIKHIKVFTWTNNERFAYPNRENP